jgi:SAM-dependent methyltransferase
MYSIQDSYIENNVNSTDSTSAPYWKSLNKRDTWQIPIYKYIGKELAALNTPVRVLELGSGTGQKAFKYFKENVSTYCGVDQSSGISISQAHSQGDIWKTLDFGDSAGLERLIQEFKPDFVVCIDVIEHLENPDTLLKALKNCSKSTRIFLSTPAREYVEKSPLNGPPRNPLHVREWTCFELAEYLTHLGFIILLQSRFLPRSYNFFTIRELTRLLVRAIKRLALPDNKSCQLVILGVS